MNCVLRSVVLYHGICYSITLVLYSVINGFFVLFCETVRASLAGVIWWVAKVKEFFQNEFIIGVQ